MKILYGIQGTGNGHITRARVMAKAFKSRGVEVDYVFSGRAQEGYFDMEPFEQYQAFKGLSFAHQYGSVSYLKTIRQADLVQFRRDVYAIDVDEYDLIINDFEPVTAWAGRLGGKTVINISHQGAFTHQNVPSKGLGWLNRQILNYFAPADITLGVHWFHFGESILPPFIEREENVVNESSVEDVLVYMPFEDLDDILNLLSSQHSRRFVVYHPAIDQDTDLMGVALRKPCRRGFLQELERCNGVVANAGFELSSEALCAGKKLLLKPLEGQFEQASNAETLRQLGLASVMSGLDELELDAWLNLPNNEAINYPSDATPLVDWLLAGDYNSPDKLCKSLWQSISLPRQAPSQQYKDTNFAELA